MSHYEISFNGSGFDVYEDGAWVGEYRTKREAVEVVQELRRLAY